MLKSYVQSFDGSIAAIDYTSCLKRGRIERSHQFNRLIRGLLKSALYELSSRRFGLGRGIFVASDICHDDSSFRQKHKLIG